MGSRGTFTGAFGYRVPRDRPSEAARHEEKWEEVAADTDLSLKRYEGKFDRADKSISYFYRLSVLQSKTSCGFFWREIMLRYLLEMIRMAYHLSTHGI